jgi:hypothetical protein
MAERTRTTGWLPNQHGAWAMLLVPFAAGAVLRWQADGPQISLVPMFATWVLGYFAFHAASGLLKAAPARRGRWVPALALYGVTTLLAGLTTLWLAGPNLAWWLAVFVLPLGVALWLASRRKERHVAGGLLTTFVAAAMMLVARFPDPLTMLHDPAFVPTAQLAAIMFGYFGGTVLHVKAMIRERRQLGWRNASIAWHAAWTVATAALAVTGQVSRVWPVFFLVTTVRAWGYPIIAERRAVRPLAIGLVEIGLSTAAIVFTILSPAWPSAA